MTQFNSEYPPESTKSYENYPIESDSAFTPDEIESIKLFKSQQQKKLQEKYTIHRILEQSFWSVTSYSLCRWLILSSGGNGFMLAIAVAFLTNNIVNRDCFDTFNVNKNSDGWEVTGMGKLLKFAFSSVVAGCVFFSAASDFIYMSNNSKETYKNLQATIEEFNTLPSDEKNSLYVLGAVVGVGAFVTAISTLKGDK